MVDAALHVQIQLPVPRLYMCASVSSLGSKQGERFNWEVDAALHVRSGFLSRACG